MTVLDGTFLDGCSIEIDTLIEGEASLRAVEFWAERFGPTSTVTPHWGDHLMAALDIAPLLIVKDVINGGEAYVNRFWGTRLTAAFGFDATGKRLEDYYSDPHVEQLRKLYDMTFARRKPVKIGGNAAFFEGRDFVQFESVQLPLYDADGKPAHVFIAYDFFRG